MTDQNNYETRSCELSIVVPCYNEAEALGLFFDQLKPVLNQITDDYEIVLINDGSKDRTLEIAQAAHREDERIKVIDLTRNFGKEAALSAGLDVCVGRAVVPIDADLQDPPELIVEMVAQWREGFDVVLAVRKDRKSDTWGKRTTARWFYTLMGSISDIEIPHSVGDFRLMDRRVIEALKLLPERTRFMKGLFAWLGYRQTAVYYTRPERAAGEGKWNYWKLWNFALDGVFSFSTLPLRIWTYVGMATTLFSLIYIVIILIRTLVMGADVPGYPSLLVTILFFSGLIMLGLGIIGEYLGRVFIEVKQRPLYLIKDTLGMPHPGPAAGRGHGSSDERGRP